MIAVSREATGSGLDCKSRSFMVSPRVQSPDNDETFMTFNLVPSPPPVPTLDATALVVFVLALVGAFFVLRRVSL